MVQPRTLTQGANIEIAPAQTIVRLSCGGASTAVDGQALLVAANDRVRSDSDFVFYNAPRHPSGSVGIGVIGTDALVEINCHHVEQEIDRIVLCLSSDSAVANGALFQASVEQNGVVVAKFEDSWPATITALMVGEVYRRGTSWKFRAVGQGWESGLAGLATSFGVTIDDAPEPARGSAVPTASGPVPATMTQPTSTSAFEAGWYVDNNDPRILRWWDAFRWTEHTRAIPDGPGLCSRCGQHLRSRRFASGTHPCRYCEGQIAQFLAGWRLRVMDVLTSDGPRGQRWEDLWLELRFERIPDSVGQDAARSAALGHLEQVVAFAFADGEIEETELTDFEATVHDLNLTASPQLSSLIDRMHRGREMTKVRAGELPTARESDIHLDSDELLYLAVPAQRVRHLQSGPRRDSGRLLVSNKKVRFVGPSAGTEMSWTKIVGARSEYSTVVIQATTARGGGIYEVRNSDYVAAVVEGALRRAKRLVLDPGRRDTRSIPQHVKSEVWRRDGGRCAQCGDDSYLEYDHVIPLSRGGATSIGNLQILCRRCNLAKGAQI
ncbi:DUF2510 domain-containing protein [Gordonia sp. TBRC 11910]|uniref:DUF2510 domain-containing protein n=2 Tax=Gordonia asplenii TaxID=2725283 RepID=A0A848KQZ4_9ACTN|nr:DUF2510 domain-containing protein [Gordonia asplenii]